MLYFLIHMQANEYYIQYKVGCLHCILNANCLHIIQSNNKDAYKAKFLRGKKCIQTISLLGYFLHLDSHGEKAKKKFLNILHIYVCMSIFLFKIILYIHLKATTILGIANSCLIWMNT